MKDIIDVHCHLIPGVDDGVQTYKTALEIITKEYHRGVGTMILTPHFRRKVFEPDKKIVYHNYKKLKYLVKQQIPEMKLYLGCELHASMGMVDRLDENSYLRMAGTEYVLVEFSEMDSAEYICERLRSIQMAGYKPIIAHAERYSKLNKNLKLIKEFVGMGIWIQVNADSILGKEGWCIKRLCRKWVKNDLVHLVGSDVHNQTDRVSNLKKCADYLEKKNGGMYAKKIFISNPMKIIKAQERKNGNETY